MELGLKGKVAVVTGGSEGIGAATAMRLALEGAKVAICARRREPLDKVAAAIRARGGEVFVQPTDMSKADEIERFVRAVVDRYGYPDRDRVRGHQGVHRGELWCVGVGGPAGARPNGVGADSGGDRFVVGWWSATPIGPMRDVMWARPDGERVLLVDREEAARFITAVYGFDRVEVVDVAGAGDDRSLQLTAGSVELALTAGAGWRLPFGRWRTPARARGIATPTMSV